MLWKILFLPGFIVLWLGYFMPTEWGKERNVSKMRRQYKEHPMLWSVIYSIPFYIYIIFIFLAN